MGPAERLLRYLLRQNKIFKELRQQERELNVEQNRVQEYINEAKRRSETQAINYKDAEDWLTLANNVLNDVQSLELRIEENKRCFPWCTNWIQRYQLSRKIEQTTMIIFLLLLSSTFITQSFGSKSSISTFNRIMEALKDDEVNMIAVWGMAGVGKTTLVKEVCNEAESLQLFHKVIFVDVSPTPDIGKIQERIADFLDLKLQNWGQEGKAGHLRNQLKKEEKVLIILDGMWNRLNLQEIGIPLGENGKGCKIILTTRLGQVCRGMDSQVTVSLGVLEEDEAWTLFKMKASLDNASPDVITVAQKVAKECGGLPIAIVTLARALISKDHSEWELALNQLQSSGFDDDVYFSLKTSYDDLSSETSKRCFLLCALYPKHYFIDVEDLVRCAWSLGIHEDCMSIKEVRFQVYAIIDSLKNSSLLLEDDSERYVKMHDVVHRAARRIASEEDNDFAIGSHNESSKQKLEFLLLDNYDGKTPIEYFEEMPELKVLNLKVAFESRNNFFSLNTLESLMYLRVLKLRGFKQLEDISALANLAKLEILSLHNSEFQESVDKLGELKNLIVLDIHQCKFLLRFPPNVIQKLKKIEELHLYYATIKRSKPGARTGEASISTPILPELNFLPRLSSLLLEVPSLHVSEDFVFPKVERFRIAINRRFQTDPMSINSPRFLTISGRLPLNVISKLLWEVESLELSNITENDIEFLTDTTAAGKEQVARILQNLKDVRIEKCNNLQVIFQMKAAEDYVLLNLKGLSLQKLSNLEYIWKIPTQRIRLQSLEAIKIEGCGKLKSLFSFSLAKTLFHLGELEINGCGELKQVVEEIDDGEQEISPNNSALSLPELRFLKIYNCGKLEYIFPMLTQGLPKLQKLSLWHLYELKQISRPANQRDQNGNQLPELQVFSALKELTLRHCPKLTGAKIHDSEPLRAYLKDLWLSNVGNQLCKDIILLQGGYFLSGMKKLILEEINELQDIWKNRGLLLTLHNLSYLKVSKCNKLTTIFTVQLARNLPQLSYLEVQGCEELEQVVIQDEILPPSMASHKLAHRKPVCFPNLEEICIMGCNKLKSLFPVSCSHLQKLKRLEVKGAPNLREIFGPDNEAASMTKDEKMKEISLPKLEILVLEDLPELLCFTPLGYPCVFPALSSLTVKGCWKMCTGFSVHGDTKGSHVRAKTEENIHRFTQGNVDTNITSGRHLGYGNVYWPDRPAPQEPSGFCSEIDPLLASMIASKKS